MSMRTSLPKNNFSSGQIDRDIKGRFELPLLQNGHEISRNFFHTVKGDCFYRSGFEFLDEIGYAALYEFKFNQEQSYLLVFEIEYIKFWSYNNKGELVQVIGDNNEPLKLAHPYGTEVFNLNMTQNCDVLYINHNEGHYAEYQLTRTASNSFTLEKTTYTNTGDASLSSTSEDDNHGFPCTCAFYENRLNRCSSSNYPTYLYGSKGADYNNITVGTGTNDGYQFDLAEANSKALWIESGVNSLLVGTAEGILAINGGSVGQAITPTDISAKLSCRDGVGKVRPIHKDNYVFFVSSNKRLVYMFEYDVLLEQFKATNLSKGNYEITKGGIKKLANKFDRFGLIFALCGGKLLSICFSNDEAVNAWSEYITDGEFIDICSVTRPDGDYDLFANIKRNINGTNKYYLEKLTEIVEFSRFEDCVSDVPKGATAQDVADIKQNDKFDFYRLIAEELRGCNYLDSSVKYSGLKNIHIEYNPETHIISTGQSTTHISIYDGSFENVELTNGFWKITLEDDITGINGAVTKTMGVYMNYVVVPISGSSYATIQINMDLYKSITKNIYKGKYTQTKSRDYSCKDIDGTVVSWNKITFENKVPIFCGKLKDTPESSDLYYTGTLAVNTQLYYHASVNSITDSMRMIPVGKITELNATNKTITVNADVLTPSDNNYMGKIEVYDNTSVEDRALTIGIYQDAFKDSFVGKRLWFKTTTGKEYGTFEVEEFIDDNNMRVKTLIEPTINSCDNWYISATQFSGLEHLEGKTVSVIGDGGYVGDFVVESGEIDITKANKNKVGVAVIGLKYKGILKSPNLGVSLQNQGTQTFSNMKNIYKIGLMLNFSAGGKVGTNLYDLEEVQDFNPEGLYDIPPLPIDDFKEIEYQDDYDKDKHYFIVQDSPLPFHITAIIPYYKHVSRV